MNLPQGRGAGSVVLGLIVLHRGLQNASPFVGSHEGPNVAEAKRMDPSELVPMATKAE